MRQSQIKKIGAVTCKTLHPDGSIDCTGQYLSISGIARQDHLEKDHFVEIIGNVTMFRVETLKRIGLFDEIYLPFYGSDEIDISERLRKASYRIFYVNRVKIYHMGAVSTSGKHKVKITFTKREIDYTRVRGAYIMLLRYRPHLLLNNFIYYSFWSFLKTQPTLKFRTFNEIRMRFFMPVRGLAEALSTYKMKKVPSLKT